MAARDSPMLNPAASFWSNVLVGRAVGSVSESVLQTDELITALAQEIEQFSDVVCL